MSAGESSLTARLKSASLKYNLLTQQVSAIAELVLVNWSEFICNSLSLNKSLYSNGGGENHVVILLQPSFSSWIIKSSQIAK